MKIEIPVIDLFAGPGGLSEGFSRYSSFARSGINFNVGLSVEMDPVAHATLRLRAFFRQFRHGQAPVAYYNYIRSEKGAEKEKWLTELKKLPEWGKAEEEALCAELGGDDLSVFDLVSKAKKAIGNSKDWVLLGGPPCKAYSLAGRSRRVGAGSEERQENIEKLEEDFYSLKMHTLYLEYIEVLAILQPSVFVMENVKGVLSSKVKIKDGNGGHKYDRVFDHIKRDLQDPYLSLQSSQAENMDDISGLIIKPPRKYRIYPFVEPKKSDDIKDRDFLIRSEMHGVPQKRHRVIILGVREDVDVSPEFLAPYDEGDYATVRESIGNMPALRSGRSCKLDSKTRSEDAEDTSESWLKAINEQSSKNIDMRNIPEANIKESIRKIIKRTSTKLDRGGQFISGEDGEFDPDPVNKKLLSWLKDSRLGGVIQHNTRSHMDTDFPRYLFCSIFARETGSSPMLADFPVSLLPDHKNVKSESGEVKNLEDFANRFKVQISDQPATTVTAHISKDGHYYIHYDPWQCRSFTVREAARIQTFPDNYHFEGGRTDQYLQVGNAVPPFLAVQLAGVVAGVIRKKNQK